MSGGPWLKISFDSSLPGVARIRKTGPLRLRKAKGQWVVFDKSLATGDGGLKTYSGSPLFSADTFDACCQWIDEAPLRAVQATIQDGPIMGELTEPTARLVQDAKDRAAAVRNGSLRELGETVSRHDSKIPIIARRDIGNGYLESDQDFVLNNLAACVQFLETEEESKR